MLLEPRAVFDEFGNRDGGLALVLIIGLHAGCRAPVADPCLLVRRADARVPGCRLEEHPDRHVLEPPAHRGPEGPVLDAPLRQMCGGGEAIWTAADHHRVHFLVRCHGGETMCRTGPVGTSPLQPVPRRSCCCVGVNWCISRGRRRRRRSPRAAPPSRAPIRQGNLDLNCVGSRSMPVPRRRPCSPGGWSPSSRCETPMPSGWPPGARG